MAKIKAIISDSDGTLVNTMYLIRHGQYEATVSYLQALGIPHHDIPTYDVYESYINKSVGGNTRETLEKTIRLLYRETHEHHLQKIDYDAIDANLGPIQDRIAPLYVNPFHGLTELFTWLGKNGINLGVFTSGSRRHIIRHYGVALPALGFTDLFKSDEIPVSERFDAFLARVKAVYGIKELQFVTCEDVTRTKPDPEGILKLMDQMGLGKDEVIAMGDHPVDMQAAKAAGLHAIGISHGFSTPADLKEAGAIKIVDDLKSLPKLIQEHNSGKTPLF
jgi:phosphoglycolate phosphatase-like HAD superfamily hydrolase